MSYKSVAGLGALVLFLVGLMPARVGAAATTTGGVTYVTKNYVLRRGEWKTFRVPCPRGTHVLGGGHLNGGGFTDVIGAHSFPYDSDDRGRVPDDGWAALLGGFNGRHNVTMYAQCARHLPTYVTSTHPVTEPRTRSVGTGPACANGQRPLSGGTLGHRFLQEIESLGQSAPGDIQYWGAAADNVDNEPRTLTAIAVCSNLPVATPVAQATVQTRDQEPVSTSCPVDKPLAVGGGHRVLSSGFADATIASTHPLGTDGWRAWVDNYSLSDSLLFIVEAACIAPLS